MQVEAEIGVGRHDITRFVNAMQLFRSIAGNPVAFCAFRGIAGQRFTAERAMKIRFQKSFSVHSGSVRFVAEAAGACRKTLIEGGSPEVVQLFHAPFPTQAEVENLPLVLQTVLASANFAPETPIAALTGTIAMNATSIIEIEIESPKPHQDTRTNRREWAGQNVN